MSPAPKIAAVIAMDEKRLIGQSGRLPWNVPEDMAHFRQLTTGHVVVMGRKTWDSLPQRYKPLPGRVNVVVSRAAASLSLPDGVLRASNPHEAIRVASSAADNKVVWVIGGAELYRELLPVCDEVHLTVVQGTHEGDAWLPEFEQNFLHISETPGQQCTFRVYARKS